MGACLKHLVGNEAETERHTVDVRIDEATLREVYLLPFEIAVADANPWMLMAAYNRVNGVPATEQDAVINGVVKGEWSYDGVVVSDWFATTSTAPAITGGLDLVMPGPDGSLGRRPGAGRARTARCRSRWSTTPCAASSRLAERTGALGGQPGPADVPEPTDAGRRADLRRYAVAGHDRAGQRRRAAPRPRTPRIALIGVPARETLLQGGGSAQVTPPSQASILDGLEAALPGRVTYTGGVEIGSPPPARPGFVIDPVDGRPGMRVAADRGRRRGAARGARRRRPPAGRHRRRRAPARSRASGWQPASSPPGPLQLGVIGIGAWTVDRRRGAPDGRRARRSAACPARRSSPRRRSCSISPSTGPSSSRPSSSWPTPTRWSGWSPGRLRCRTSRRSTAAVAAARDADVAVVVVGLTEEQETESRDKATLALPGAQDALVTAVAAAARRTVVVVNAATPVLMPWADRVDAVLVAGLPGQEGGHAVADALLGLREPSGRLVTTWPVADGATPAWSVTPVDGALPYDEGTLRRVPRARGRTARRSRASGSGTASATAPGTTSAPVSTSRR